MSSGLRDLLLHPDTFFARVAREKTDLIPPFAVVGMGAGLFAIIHVLFWVWDRSGWNFEPLAYGGFAQQFIVSLIAAAVVIPFLLWGLFSVLVFILSRIAGGTGSFPATIQNVGYGMLPWSVSAGIPFLVYLYKLATYTGGPVVGGYSGIWLMPPVFCTLPLLGIMIWSGYLWAIAVRHTHRLTPGRAALVAVVPPAMVLIASVPFPWYLAMILKLATGS